jgi:hypothetical protein
MFRLITPIILIGLSITGFLVFVSPLYKEISLLKEQVSSYNQALDNSKALENERDKLTQKYSTIDPVNLDKLTKLLPDNVDNIRLILEIEKIASPYGMILKDVGSDIFIRLLGGREIGSARERCTIMAYDDQGNPHPVELTIRWIFCLAPRLTSLDVIENRKQRI